MIRPKQENHKAGGHLQGQLSPGLRGGPDSALLWVHDLCKDFHLEGRGLFNRKEQTLRAVDGVSFDIQCGETFGLVGESGSGKSTIARCVLRLQDYNRGQVYFEGTDLGRLPPKTLRQYRKRMQIVFQDPYASLDPRMSVQSIVEEPLIIHGLAEREERLERVHEVLRRVGIARGQFDLKPHEFSGGQRQRIGIARALVLEPKLVILDEPVSALDVSIQAQVINLLRNMQRRLELTYVFIVHDLALAEYFCDRLAVLYLGAVMEMGDREALFHEPLHPYTVTLLSAVPIPDLDPLQQHKRITVKGEPDYSTVRAGCRFRPRCPVGQNRDICGKMEPPLVEAVPGHLAACHFPGELTLS
jgi:oligopeptide/dipeptide ABC transporter ATP-binding protein